MEALDVGTVTIVAVITTNGDHHKLSIFRFLGGVCSVREISFLSGWPMNRLLVRCGTACFFALLMAGPSWGQKTGNPAPPAQPSGPLAGSSGPNVASPTPSREMPTPLYIRGRVLMETGQPVPEPVSVGLSCGMRTVQVVHTDPKGYFQFAMGAGPQSNIDS